MNVSLAQKAIAAALECDWDKALNYNLEILQKNPEDIQALNRLAKAEYELGNKKKAISYTNKVLKLDSLNTIALKNLERFKKETSPNKDHDESHIHSQIFLEEPGKTKIVSLIHLADSDKLMNLNCAQKVNIAFGNHRVNVTTNSGQYIGKLPDDLASRIIRLKKSGYDYEAFIKTVGDAQVRLFLRETKRQNSESGPSFPGN